MSKSEITSAQLGGEITGFTWGSTLGSGYRREGNIGNQNFFFTPDAALEKFANMSGPMMESYQRKMLAMPGIYDKNDRKAVSFGRYDLGTQQAFNRVISLAIAKGSMDAVFNMSAAEIAAGLGDGGSGGGGGGGGRRGRGGGGGGQAPAPAFQPTPDEELRPAIEQAIQSATGRVEPGLLNSILSTWKGLEKRNYDQQVGAAQSQTGGQTIPQVPSPQAFALEQTTQQRGVEVESHDVARQFSAFIKMLGG